MNEIDEIITNINIQQDFISAYILSGILLASLIIVTILSKSISRNHPIAILGFFLALVLIINIDFYLCYTGLIKNLPHLFNSNEFFTLLLGPTLLIFINSLLFDKKIVAKNISIHLIVPMGYLFTQLGYHFLSAEVKLLYYLDSYGMYENWSESHDSLWLQLSHYFNRLFLYILVASAFYYGLMSIKYLRRYFASISHIKSNSFTSKNRFSRILILLFLFIFIVVFLLFFSSPNDKDEYIIAILTTTLLYVIGFYMIYESRLFSNSWLKEKYQTSGINLRISEIFLATKTHLEETQSHFKEDFSLKMISSELNIPSNYISQAIYETTGIKFNQYINRYRIEEAKKRILDIKYENLTLEAIANSIGFRSRTSFNNAFKDNTGMTPSQYRNQKPK